MDLDLRRNRIRQTINLGELLDVDFTGQSGLRLAIAQRVLDHIRDRTQDGRDVDGNSFAGYSEDYINSAEFILTGKSASEVNMTLTGQMLSSMDVLSEGPNTIVIGIDDPTQAPKAYNHNVGDTVPRRAFFGVREGEMRDLIESEFGDDLDSLRGRPEDQRTIRDIFGESTLRQALRATSALGQAPATVQQTGFFTTVGELLFGGD